MTEQSTSNKPKKKALLYCRGENPLFLALAQKLEDIVDLECVDNTDERVQDGKRNARYLYDMITEERYEQIFTDKTLQIIQIDEDYIGGNMDNDIRSYLLGLESPEAAQLDERFKGLTSDERWKKVREEKKLNEEDRHCNKYMDYRKNLIDKLKGHLCGVYDLLKLVGCDHDYADSLDRVIQHYKKEGKQLAVIEYGLDDHLSSKMKWPDGASNIYQFFEAKGVPIIGRDHTKLSNYQIRGYKLNKDSYQWYGHGKRIDGNVKEGLSHVGIDPDKAVLIADHHIYNMGRDDVTKTQTNEIPIQLVCPCCINGTNYTDNSSRLGYTLHPSPLLPESLGNEPQFIDELSEIIRKRNYIGRLYY